MGEAGGWGGLWWSPAPNHLFSSSILRCYVFFFFRRGCWSLFSNTFLVFFHCQLRWLRTDNLSEWITRALELLHTVCIIRFAPHLNWAFVFEWCIHAIIRFWRPQSWSAERPRHLGFLNRIFAVRGLVYSTPFFLVSFSLKIVIFFNFRYPPPLWSVFLNPFEPGSVQTGSSFWLFCGLALPRVG